MFNSSTPLVLKTWDWQSCPMRGHPRPGFPKPAVGQPNNQPMAPWPMLGFRTTRALGAPARLARLVLFKAWRSPRPLLPRPKPSACCVNWQLTWKFFRKPKFLELDFLKKSVRSPRAFCQLDPQTRKTSGPWQGAAKASLKPTFTCGICKWQTSAANACWASCSGASSAPHKTNDDEVA